MSEIITANSEFEHNNYHEIETKKLPIFPERLLELRKNALPIEQFYLSHPSEPFSLRFRQYVKNDQLQWSATLKDRGNQTTDGLDRLEVETPVSRELFDFYNSETVPSIKKLRAEVNNGVAIDFFEDNHVQIESEDPIAWAQFEDQYGRHFIDITGDRLADNEWRAHFAYRQIHDGKEALVPQETLSAQQIALKIAGEHAKSHQVVARITGRSGSGKSTLIRQVLRELEGFGIECTVLSTDDYHRGATWLKRYNGDVEWNAWDDEIVYDTAQMAQDIAKLHDGESIPKRVMDFSSGEPHIRGTIQPNAVIIIEGIYAGSPDLNEIGDITVPVMAPTATCIGRRILRDAAERPQFADYEKNLAYILEHAEPMWQKQQENN